MAKKLKKSDLNKEGFSTTFLKSIKRGEEPIYLGEIYTTFKKYCKLNKVNMVLSISEMHSLLRSFEIRNDTKNFQIIFHHQGTTWFANEVFFIGFVDKNLPKQIITKNDAMREIVKQLAKYNNHKLGDFAVITQSQRSIRRMFENKIEDIFKEKHKVDFYKELHKQIKEFRYNFERLEILQILAQHKYLILKNVKFINDLAHIKEFVNKDNYIKKLLEEISTEMKASNFANFFALKQEERRQLMKGFNRNKLSLDYLGSGLAKSFSKIFNDIINQGLNNKQIEASIKAATQRKIRNNILETTNSYNNRVKTLSRTFAHGIDNLINFNQSREAGIEYFKYMGNPNPERAFCVEHFGKVYHIDKISELDNGQHLSVLGYLGGYNCRHSWTPASKEEYDASRT